MKAFFILSLPRSRTAWLSNFLTFGDSFCFHEGLIGCRDMKALREKMEATGFDIVGNSDCGNILFIDEILKEFPDAKFLFVHRDRDEILQRLEFIGLQDNGMTDKALDRMIEYSDLGPHYGFNDLSQAFVCAEIYEYLTEQDFNINRSEQLDKLDISIFVDRKVREVAEHMKETVELFKRTSRRTSGFT